MFVLCLRVHEFPLNMLASVGSCVCVCALPFLYACDCVSMCPCLSVCVCVCVCVRVMPLLVSGAEPLLTVISLFMQCEKGLAGA